MAQTDLIYLLFLVLSIPYGHAVKLCDKRYKKLLCLGAGVLMMSLLVRQATFHSFVTIVVNYSILRCMPKRYMRQASFIFTFSYLLFFRLCGYLGFAFPKGESNAVQLLVTLRMVSLSFELHEKEDTFSLFDVFSYGYCYIGLMTGPFYTYKTFQDMINQDGKKFVTVWPALLHLKALLFIVPVYIVLKTHYPISFLESEECLNHSWGVLYILWILFPTFTWFRWRFYIGWLLAESMCMSCGLGAYPPKCNPKPGHGPTFDALNEESNIEELNFETIHNIDIYAVETAPTMKLAMRSWNMTVQWWMATYVYKKLPVKSPQIRLSLLLFVSAFWHGVYTGYYFTFMSVALVVIAETRMASAVTPYLNDSQRYYWDWITWFCLYRSFEYLSVAFMLLRLELIWKVWLRMYFIGHVMILLSIALPVFIPKSKKK